jgi:hypothetical protein
MDPAAGAHETLLNRRMAEVGLGARFCYHADSTLTTTVTRDGIRILHKECDYCPASVTGPAGGALPYLRPWIFPELAG